MLRTDDIVTLINNLDNPTAVQFFGIDLSGLERYVKPETNVLSLVMLSKARGQGLDVVFVNDDKFFDGSFNHIKGTLLNGTGPFEGAWYIEFELAPVLLHDQTFSLIDHSESVGYGVMIDTGNLINELISHCLKDTGKVDYGNQQEFQAIETIQQLADYISRMLTIPKPKEAWHWKLPSLGNIGIFLFGTVTLITFGIYYIFKYINRFFRYINYLLHKPL